MEGLGLNEQREHASGGHPPQSQSGLASAHRDPLNVVLDPEALGEFQELGRPSSFLLVHHQPQRVIDRDGEVLDRAEAALRRLDRGMAEQELDLLEVSARVAAEFSAGAPAVMRRKLAERSAVRIPDHQTPDPLWSHIDGPVILPPWKGRKSRPSVSPAASPQASTRGLTAAATGTVRRRLPLPTRFGITQPP